MAIHINEAGVFIHPLFYIKSKINKERKGTGRDLEPTWRVCK